MNSKPKAIIVDIDGVICRVNYKVNHEEFNWNEFIEKDLDNDKKVFHSMITSIKAMAQVITSEISADIIFLTSRPERMRKQTQDMLRAYLNWFNYYLFMSSDTESQEQLEADVTQYKNVQSQQKEKYIEKILDAYDVIFAIDDHEENCEMYHKYGISTLKPYLLQ